MEVHEKPIYRGRGNWLKREGLDSFQKGGGGGEGLAKKRWAVFLREFDTPIQSILVFWIKYSDGGIEFKQNVFQELQNARVIKWEHCTEID